MAKLAPDNFNRSSGRFRPWKQLAVGVICLAVVGYFLLAIAPRVIALVVPANWWASFGADIEKSFVGDASPCSSPDGDAALKALARRLSGSENEFVLTVYDLTVMNAWALPGGRIILTQELLDAAAHPDEVAGVLAHEIGHARQRHAEMQIARDIGIGVLLGLGSSNGLSGDIAVLRYSREAEREADAIAGQLMIDARLDTAYLKSFFEMLKRREGKVPANFITRALDMLSTHPVTDERIAAVPPFPQGRSTTPSLDSRAWHALKNICR